MIDFGLFRASLLMQGMTVKNWCSLVGVDPDRYRNIQQGRVKPTDQEIKLIKNEIMKIEARK